MLKFKDGTGFNVSGNLVCNGTPDSMIVFAKADLEVANMGYIKVTKDTMSYVKMVDLNMINSKIQTPLRNCIITNCTGVVMDAPTYRVNIIENSCFNSYASTEHKVEGLNMVANKVNTNIFMNYEDISAKNVNVFNNFDSKGYAYNLRYFSSIANIVSANSFYFGSGKESIVRAGIRDMYNPQIPEGYGLVDLSEMRAIPSSESHGLVWKVVVNGYDAQDEFEKLPPLGVGRHKFEVYFNRSMDALFTPFMAMGPRPPYTQNVIAEDGFWNENRTVYTAYLTITGKTNTDGLNRIYVSNAVESVEDYYIRKDGQNLLSNLEPLVEEVVNNPLEVAFQVSDASKDGYLTGNNKASSDCAKLYDGKQTQSSIVKINNDEYLQIDLGVDKNTRYFRLNYTAWSLYVPNEITVQGSNDGVLFEDISSFSTLDKINPLPTSSDCSWESLLIDALIPYRYYRFFFNADSSRGYSYISEFGIEVLNHVVKEEYLSLLSDEEVLGMQRNLIIAEDDFCRIETRDNSLLRSLLDQMYIDYNRLALLLGYPTIKQNPLHIPSAPDWVIPIENVRFNVEVSAAGSMVTGLMAEAGLGKVSLTWETDEEDFADLLGYNIYRYTMDEAGVSSDSIIVNPTVIDSEETSFVDYDVVPGTTYYYVIKQLTTSLTSHALSNAVAATPLTASKGDANGSMNVDIADVVTEVAYITYQDPQPFIFEAADVNSDAKVNVLDVVGTIGIITTPAETGVSSIDDAPVRYYVKDGVLYVENTQPLGGVQVRLDVVKGTEITALEALTGMEQTSVWTSDSEYLFLAYSMSGRTLAPGTHALLQIGSEAIVTEVVISDAKGRNITAVDGNATGIGKVEAVQLQMPSPNPFTTVLRVPYTIGKSGSHEVTISFSDLAGRIIDAYHTVNTPGEYTYTWYPRALQKGLYLVNLYVDGELMQTVKVIKN